MRLLTVVPSARSARGARLHTPLPVNEFSVRVAASADDAQEIVSTGVMDVTAEGSDFVLESTIGDLPILGGARFTNVPIGQGEDVPYTALRFRARANNTPQVIARIRAQAIDDAPAFTATDNDISGRTLTTAYVDWDMPEWATGQTYDSPNLNSLVQEVINRAGWVPGNAIVFVWEAAPTDPALSRRRAYAYDLDATRAPLLLSGTVTDPEPEPLPGSTQSLVGDPTFDRANLTGDTKLWYDRMIVDHIVNDYDGTLTDAASDNTDRFGRSVKNQAQAVMAAFRLTGDLEILDWLDTILETMRLDLRDEGLADGYLNWRDTTDSGGTSRQNTDLWQSNEMKTHALVASVAAALDKNRDLTSPTNVDYGAHADFWKDYLVNHFEAKWRDREGVNTGFPIMENNAMATMSDWTRWHYYMGILMGDSAYTSEAERMLNLQLDSNSFRTVTLGSDSAWVWPRDVLSMAGADNDYLMPITYCAPVFATMIEFHLAGFGTPANASFMEKLARSHTEFLQDTSDVFTNDFAADIGGEVDREGLWSDSRWSRMTTSNWRIRSFPQIAYWDKTDSVYGIASQLYRNDRLQPNVGCFLKLWLDDAP